MPSSELPLISNNQHVGTGGERDFGSRPNAARFDELSKLREPLETRTAPSYGEPDGVSAVICMVAPILRQNIPRLDASLDSLPSLLSRRLT